MQDGGGGDGNSMHALLGILADGEEQARRLLGELPPADDDQRPLGVGGVARQLLRTFGKAIGVAKAIEAAGGDSPRSADESAGRDAVQAQAQERHGHGVCKRRRGLSRWTEKFRIPDDANLEYTPDDGFSWRKCGQKDILGAKFPRGYYRCTYRNAQGCAATRQVQRSDADLAVFDVTYRGAHTCLQTQRRAPPPPPPLPAAHDGAVQQQATALRDTDMRLLESFKNGLKVETDWLPPPTTTTTSFHGHGHAAFSFPYTAAACYSRVESGQQHLHGGGCFAPASFSSPAASTSAGPGYFSVSVAAHCTVGAHDSPELAEVVSAATASDPAAGFDYSMCQYQDL